MNGVSFERTSDAAERRPTRRIWWWLLSLVVVSLLFFITPRPGATSSSLSKAPDGLWAMRAYLEARGVDVEVLDAPIATEPGPHDHRPGTLLLALPWQRFPGSDLEVSLHRHLRAGGYLIVAYDGNESAFQTLVFEALGLTPMITLRDDPPFAPLAWWRYQQERITLVPGGSVEATTAPHLEINALDEVPNMPSGGRVHFTSGGSPVIFDFDRLGGRVFVLPVDLLHNGELANRGHLDWLEALMRSVSGRWLIDEYHHGLIRPELLERSATAHAWDLFVLHLVLLYGLAVFAAGRRFGPAWREELTPTGSTNDFLRSLGVLHHRLGHHRDAARQLLERVRRLEPTVELPSPLPSELDPDKVEGGPSFTAFAAELSRYRKASKGLS